MYDRAASFWQLLRSVCEHLDDLKQLEKSKSRAGQLWGGNQRFFRLMLMACKVGNQGNE